MSDSTKRIQLSVRVTVLLTVDAEKVGDEINVISVSGFSGLPSAQDVMDALDAEDDFEQLDNEYENAPSKE